MINPTLVEFIKKSKTVGQTDEQIRLSLMANGWREIDVDEGFRSVNGVEQVSAPHFISEEPIIANYAGFWVRLLASFIDAVLFLPVVFFLVFFVQKGSQSALPETMLYVLYDIFIIFMLARYQATPGKMLMGLKVVSGRQEGLGKPTLIQLIIRETIGKIASGMIFNIGYIMIGFTERKQGLHDKIAGTLVISTRS